MSCDGSWCDWEREAACSSFSAPAVPAHLIGYWCCSVRSCDWLHLCPARWFDWLNLPSSKYRWWYTWPLVTDSRWRHWTLRFYCSMPSCWSVKCDRSFDHSSSSPRTAWYRLANVCNMHISAKRRMLPQVHMWSQKCLASALWSTHGRDQWKKVDCVYGVEEWTDLFPLPFAFLIHQVPRTRSLLGGQKQAINRYQALNQHKLNELTTHSYGFSITRMTVTSSQSRNI